MTRRDVFRDIFGGALGIVAAGVLSMFPTTKISRVTTGQYLTAAKMNEIIDAINERR